ncbi:helix-turn-helix transcriptional regulator [Rhodanobacter aciditrophus]|uniref:helix-turn-helix transcriptional regulator n=1 Tax=Rhodanobacter aciditrophus TaxID=1623218 RepID=UPI003CF8C27F
MQNHAVPQTMHGAQEAQRPRRLIRIREATQRTGLSKAMVYRLIAAGQFPRQIRLTERTSAWVESEVQAWVDSRIAANRGIAA